MVLVVSLGHNRPSDRPPIPASFLADRALLVRGHASLLSRDFDNNSVAKQCWHSVHIIADGSFPGSSLTGLLLAILSCFLTQRDF